MDILHIALTNKKSNGILNKRMTRILKNKSKPKNYLTKKKKHKKTKHKTKNKNNKPSTVVVGELVSPSSKLLPTKKKGRRKYQPTRQ